MTEILTAVITGILALMGTVITNLVTARKTDFNIRTSQAITDTKLEALTREVREHNNFARRIPVLEEQARSMERRLRDLEQREARA